MSLDFTMEMRIPADATSGCRRFLAEFEAESTEDKKMLRVRRSVEKNWGKDCGRCAGSCLKACLMNWRCAWQARRPSAWSMVRRLSKVLHDSGRCQPDFSNGNSSSAARRSGQDSWSARLQPPEPLPRSVPIARAPPPVASAPEDDWDSNTAPRAPRTARHH